MTVPRSGRFVPGEGTAIVTERGVALVVAGIDARACIVIEEALLAGASLDRMMTSLSALGFDALPELAIAVAVADGVQLLHRGNVSVEIENGDGEIQSFNAPKVMTWREEFVAGALNVRAISGGAAATESHRVVGGTVPARQISWPVPAASGVPTVTPVGETMNESPDPQPISPSPLILAGIGSVSPAPSAQAAGPVTSLASPDGPPRPAAVSPTDELILPAAPTMSMSPDLPQHQTALVTRPTMIPDGDDPQQVVANQTVLPQPERNISSAAAGGSAPPAEPVQIAPTEADDLDFSNLVSHTVFRHVEEAAIRPTEPEDKPITRQIAHAGESGGQTMMPEWTKPPRPVSPRTGPELISGIPESGISPPQGLLLDEGDHDGRTVARPRKKAPPTNSAPVSTVNNHQPTIQAVRCVAGHFNAPHAHQCRICSQPIVDRTQILTARPSFGVLRFSTNETVAVNGPILIGRNPPSGQIVDGETATVVAIDNAELSRFHAAIHLTEWYVHVADQASMNGTMITAPGKPRQTLRPYEKVQISPGTIIELGGAVSFRFDGS